VQGWHVVAARRAGGGTTVPVLVAPEGVFAQSEWIVRYAQPQLFTPAAEQLSRWLDAELGPRTRRLIYAHILPYKRAVLPYNNQGVPRWEAHALDVFYPAVARWGGWLFDITRDTLREEPARIRAVFDTVAGRLGDGYLCGERFTAADLTFACLAAPVIAPPVYGTPLPGPEELPPALAAEFERFRAHPAGAFALRLYASRRPGRSG
jgi:glutathione S-transferase